MVVPVSAPNRAGGTRNRSPTKHSKGPGCKTPGPSPDGVVGTAEPSRACHTSPRLRMPRLILLRNSINLGALPRLAGKLAAVVSSRWALLALRYIRRVSGIDLLPHALNLTAIVLILLYPQSRVIVLVRTIRS